MKFRARAIRLRLTLTYGVVFLLTGAVLLTFGYLLVRHNLHDRHTLDHNARKLAFEQLNPHFTLPAGAGPPKENAALRAALAAGYAQAASDALHRLLIEYIAALMAMTGVSVLAGWVMAGRALAPLARMFESQRQFVANASHELRTPLAIMRTEVDVTLADPDSGAQEFRSMGETVRETIDRSEGLIAALLTLARSEMVSVRQDPIDLALLTGEVIGAFQPAVAGADLQLEADLQPAVVRGDRALLERLLANLIDNGIRHNIADGSLRVSTRTVGGEAELIVSNGGSVIDPEQLRTLTEPFRRLTRTPGGYGVGLSIVRSVAEAHRGSVQVSSPSTGGLDVRVRIPADADAIKAPPVVSEAGSALPSLTQT